MPHAQTHEHTAVAAVLLHGGILEVDELDLPAEQLAELHRHRVRLPPVAGREGVVVECDPVHDGHEE